MMLFLSFVLLSACSAITTKESKDVELSARDVVPVDEGKMEYTYPTRALHHTGVLALLAAAVAKSDAMGLPECIVVVDVSGEVLGKIRMTGAKFLSLKTALAKARTAASSGRPSHTLDDVLRGPLAAATGGDVTGLAGGLPIRIDGVLVGGIGVGSARGDQDWDIANTALAAIGAITYTF